MVITARKLAEAFRGPVIVLTDANLATGQQPFPRPEVQEEWLAPPIDQSDWDKDVPAFRVGSRDWRYRRVPSRGSAAANTCSRVWPTTSAARSPTSRRINQYSMEMRSRKLAVLQQSLKPAQGVRRPGRRPARRQLGIGPRRDRGGRRSHPCGRQEDRLGDAALPAPLEPGLEEIFKRFKKVMTVEINYSDETTMPYITHENRRYSQLAWLLQGTTLWSTSTVGRAFPASRCRQE